MKRLKTILQFNKTLTIIFILLSFYCFIFTKIIKYESNYSLDDSTLIGRVLDYQFNGNKLTMKIKSKEKVIVNYYIKTLDEKDNLKSLIHLGDTITFSGSFKGISNNTIPNTFNYKEYLYKEKIYYTFLATSLNITNTNKNIFYSLKDTLIKRIYNMENSDYLLTFILGDKYLLNGDEYSNFQNNGISHLLAISGMHITVLISILNYLLNKVKENYKLIVLSIVLLIFAFLTGFTASVLRVTLFFILNSINKKFNLRYNNLQILLITAYILIIINPFIIYDLGFIYSFVVSFGIIYYQDKITGNYFQKLFKISLIAFLFSLPITALVNYEINVMALISNLLFVPLISLVVYPLSLLTFIFRFLNPIFGFVIDITNYLNALFAKIAIFINIPKMPIILVIFFFIILICLKRNKKLSILLVLIIFICKLLPTIDNNYYVYFLDVSQGDSAVLISPHKRDVIMIDTGGKITYSQEDWMKTTKSYNLSDNIILFLKSIGVTKLDYLIISHGDYDHMGESLNFVNNFKVEKVILNCGPYNDLEQELIKVLDKKKIKHYSCIKELNIDKNKLYFLQTKEYDNENDNSNVIYTELNGYKFMFMGDASSTTEYEILNKYNLANIDVLKVGHHGSKTSSSEEFINEINPKYSIISVGKNNRYGHPNKEVLNTLEKSKIYRTDQDGSIMFKIKNNKLQVETCSP